MKVSKGYQTISFPADSSVVYVIGIEGKDRFIPIYVGESNRNIGRFGDYVSAQFTSPTDFKVGMTVRYLMEKRYRIGVKYKNSVQRRKEQSRLIKEIKRAGFKLLNDLKGYNYRTAVRDKEVEKIKGFVDEIIKAI